MKDFSLILLFVIAVLFSCSNPSENKSSSKKDSTELMNLPSGFTSTRFAEYKPQNQEESNFLSDLKIFEQATNDLDCQKVTDLYYPDYFKQIQKEVPEKSIAEIKAVFPKLIEEELAARKKSFTDMWDQAIGTGVRVTNIINRVKEGNGILYLYEYHLYLNSETDTIYRIEAEYGVAASLDNGNQWYSSSSTDLDEQFAILGYSFSHESIDEVLTNKSLK